MHQSFCEPSTARSGYTSEILAYGQATEGAPKRRLIEFGDVVQDVKDIRAIELESGIEFVDNIPDGLKIDADSE